MKRLDQATPEELVASMLDVVAERPETCCFEEMAQRAMDQLYAEFSSSIVLARMYVTVPFAALPEKNAGWVRDLAEAKGVSHELVSDTQVISLVGTAGRVPAWNDRCASRGHVGIPMTSASFIDEIPMMSRLMASLGGDLDWIEGNDTALVVSRLGTVAGTFYVPDADTEMDARGRKVISATDFVAAHGIKTVFGLGGAFASGQLLVTLIFCDEHVEREVVDAFQAPFLRFKSASAPLLKQVFRDGSTAQAADAGAPRGNARTRAIAASADPLAERTAELEALNALYLELESQLEDRTRSLRLILDSTGDGMVLVNPDGSTYGDWTSSLERWFGVPHSSEKIWEYLFDTSSPDARRFQLDFAQLIDDMLPFELAADQMPRQLTRGDAIFELDYRSVQEPEQPKRVLVIVRDVTARVAGERAAARARELHAVIRSVLRDQRGFERFVEETSDSLSGILASTDPLQQARDLHTIKGNTAVIGFETFPRLVHEIEIGLMDRSEAPSEAELQQLRHGWADALAMIAEFVRPAEPRIELSAREHDEFLRQLLEGIDVERLASIARSWRDEPARNLLARLKAQAERTAAVLEKSIQISVDDRGLRVPIESTRECWASLVHIVRNAVDHGIEPSERRAPCGKPAVGEIRLSCAVEGDWLVVTISDDGGGVDWDAIRTSAQQASLPSTSYGDLLEAIFTDGCSSRSKLSSISGCGVGLAAARGAHRAIGGELELESIAGVGTVVRARMPLAAAHEPRPSVSAA